MKKSQVAKERPSCNDQLGLELSLSIFLFFFHRIGLPDLLAQEKGSPTVLVDEDRSEP